VCSAPLIGFKNLPSGDVGTNAWSKSIRDSATSDNATSESDQHNSAKFVGVSTGMYTFYREELALTVGLQVDPSIYGITIPAGTGDRFLQNCLNACDEVVRCAGITVQMSVQLEERPTTCRLIIGSTEVGMFKRTVSR
jgi:hypothetical protein